MISAFTAVHGNPNGNKNTVIKPVNWELTGRVNTKYAADGASWPPTAASSSSSKSNPASSKPVAASTLKTTTAPAPISSASSGPGEKGSKCDGETTVCKTGLTCLNPDGICSDAACNWGYVMPPFFLLILLFVHSTIYPNLNRFRDYPYTTFG